MVFYIQHVVLLCFIFLCAVPCAIFASHDGFESFQPAVLPVTKAFDETFDDEQKIQALTHAEDLCGEQALYPAQHNTKSGWWQALSFVVLPLDILKKLSVCVLTKPLVFLQATSYLSGLHATFSAKSVAYSALQQFENSFHHFALSQRFDTSICPGRAIPKKYVSFAKGTKAACKSIACGRYVSAVSTCSNVQSRSSLIARGILSSICDDQICAPSSVPHSFSVVIREQSEACERLFCKTRGRPYSGNFVCGVPKIPGLPIQNLGLIRLFDRIVLEANACFEDIFCKKNAHDTCPTTYSWWQAPYYAINPPCDETLCPPVLF